LKYWHVVARLGMQAAEALAYAHAQGTLHRDIKPGNLLLDEDGVLCVADFGLARAMDGPELACSGDFVGTARYMAPEQLRGTADVRSDVYALGLTLYELLTLRPAFDRPEQGIAFNAGQVRAEPLRPRKIQRAIPRDLETIVLKCLAFEPAKRYATAAALGADLRRFLEDKPIHARRASWLERAARWCRRNPALATVSALAILLLVAVAVTALAGYRQTSKAYAATRVALQQAEATSQLSLKVLNGIYAQLSPQRIWIASDSDPAGQTCACIGLGTGDGSATSVERTALQLWALPETAVLLENLLAFYDILAAQGGDDRCLVLQSAAATRRVGDIRLCLGQIYRAEQEYQRAAEKLTALRTQIPADIEVSTELAHCQNEIGNVCSARREADRAYAAHQAALGILQSCPPVPQPSAEYRYELARTLYFLASKSRSVPDAPSGREVAGKARRSTAFVRQSKEYRNSAIGILEELARQDPHAPDYRLLLALCYRGIGTTPDSAANVWNAQGRQRAIEILEALTAEYPGVADYRYELIATYAWIPVSLFPWQGHSALSEEGEQSLRKGIEQSEWLVAHNPTVPHYARSQALVLAKLATTCWRKGRLAEADDLFRKALQTQSTLAAKFPELSPHDEVLLQFLRLRLAQVCQERNAAAPVSGGLDESRSLLEQCIEQLTQLLKRPELAADQLAVSSLPLAYDAQSDVLAKSGDPQAAQEAKQKAKAARAGPLSLRERGRGEGVGKADRQSNMSFGERPSP
jgi:tetratricopeptide (TPR) repeat protein